MTTHNSHSVLKILCVCNSWYRFILGMKMINQIGVCFFFTVAAEAKVACSFSVPQRTIQVLQKKPR